MLDTFNLQYSNFTANFFAKILHTCIYLVQMTVGPTSGASFAVTCRIEGIIYECLYFHYYMHFEDDEQTGSESDGSE